MFDIEPSFLPNPIQRQISTRDFTQLPTVFRENYNQTTGTFRLGVLEYALLYLIYFPIQSSSRLYTEILQTFLNFFFPLTKNEKGKSIMDTAMLLRSMSHQNASELQEILPRSFIELVSELWLNQNDFPYLSKKQYIVPSEFLTKCVYLIVDHFSILKCNVTIQLDSELQSACT